MRRRFVTHSGRLELSVFMEGFVMGSPENRWAEAFEDWAGLIRQHVGQGTHDLLVCDFSTTGPVERTASQVVLMDIFERYFKYCAVGICGIPSVSLEGTAIDWQRLCDKAAGLRIFDLDWWLEHLLPICDQFARAARGEVDLDHWRCICKFRENYGGDIINGWVAKRRHRHDPGPATAPPVVTPANRSSGGRKPRSSSGNTHRSSGASSVPSALRCRATFA